MQVVPGAPHSLVVSEVTNGVNPGVLLAYDDAKFRPVSATGASRFIFSDPSTIIATGGYNSPMVIDKLTPSGILMFGQGPSGSFESPVDFADGWILGSNGGRYDLAGSRSYQQADLTGLGAFLPGMGRLLMLSTGTSGYPIQLGAFDENTMTPLGRISANSIYNTGPTFPPRLLVLGSGWQPSWRISSSSWATRNWPGGSSAGIRSSDGERRHAHRGERGSRGNPGGFRRESGTSLGAVARVLPATSGQHGPWRHSGVV